MERQGEHPRDRLQKKKILSVLESRGVSREVGLHLVEDWGVIKRQDRVEFWKQFPRELLVCLRINNLSEPEKRKDPDIKVEILCSFGEEAEVWTIQDLGSISISEEGKLVIEGKRKQREFWGRVKIEIDSQGNIFSKGFES